MNVSRDIGLYTSFAERLTKSLYTLATSVIQLAEFNEGCGADTADLAWSHYPTECSAEAAKHRFDLTLLAHGRFKIRGDQIGVAGTFLQ